MFDMFAMFSMFAMLAIFSMFAMFSMFALRCFVVLLHNRSHSQPICMEKLIDFIRVLIKYQTCKKLKQFQSHNTFVGIVPAFLIYHVPFAVDLFFYYSHKMVPYRTFPILFFYNISFPFHLMLRFFPNNISGHPGIAFILLPLCLIFFPFRWKFKYRSMPNCIHKIGKLFHRKWIKKKKEKKKEIEEKYQNEPTKQFHRLPSPCQNHACLLFITRIHAIDPPTNISSVFGTIHRFSYE